MKLLALLFLLADAANADAQKLAALSPAAPPVYRWVTNQLFDITRSKLWSDYEMEVRRADTNGVIGQLYHYREIGGGVHDYNMRDWSAWALVVHPPVTPATGEQIAFRAMQIGVTNLTTNLTSTTLIVLDCGTTNRPHGVTRTR